jgi:hypothetical protein
VTKVKVRELEFLLLEFSYFSNIKEIMNPVLNEDDKLLSLVSVRYTVDKELVEVSLYNTMKRQVMIRFDEALLEGS